MFSVKNFKMRKLKIFQNNYGNQKREQEKGGKFEEEKKEKRNQSK